MARRLEMFLGRIVVGGAPGGGLGGPGKMGGLGGGGSSGVGGVGGAATQAFVSASPVRSRKARMAQLVHGIAIAASRGLPALAGALGTKF